MADIRELINSIKQRTDLRSIIPNLTQAKQYKYTICPFHNDTKPSMIVNKEYYYCFGCKASGDVISWYQHQNGSSFIEALQVAASMVGIQLDDEFESNANKIAKEQSANDEAHYNYLTALHEDDAAMEYLHNRGLTQETIGHFQLGYDRKQNAISIPIYDAYDRLQTFGYRFLAGEQRYKTPNSTTWSKKDNIYNPRALKFEDGPIYVAEGFFDVMSIWQSGKKRAVGLMGSQLNDGVARQFPENSQVVFVPDAKKDADFDIFKKALLQLRNMYPTVKTKVAILQDGDANSVPEEDLVRALDAAEDTEFAILKHELGKCEEQSEEYPIARAVTADIQDVWIKDDINRFLAKRWGKQIEVIRQGMNHSGETTVEVATLEDALYRLEEEERACDLQQIHMGWGGLSRLIRRPRPGHIMLAAARSGVGKTMFALNYINKTQCLNIPTLFISLEQPMTEIANRLTVMSSVPWLPIKSDELSRDIISGTYKWNERRDYTASLFQKLRICDKRLDGQGIRDAIAASSYSLGEAVKVVIVDYVGLVKAAKHYRSQYEKASDICLEIQAIAKEMDVFVIGLYQLSREGGHGTERVTIDMMRDSGVAEEVADYIVGLWKDDPNKEVSSDGLITMHTNVCKNRHGPIGEMTMYFNPDYLLIDEDETNMISMLGSGHQYDGYLSDGHDSY